MQVKCDILVGMSIIYIYYTGYQNITNTCARVESLYYLT